MPSPSSVYNLETVKTPRLSGPLLDIVSRTLRLPIIGRFLLEFMKWQNKFGEMVRFATSSRPAPGEGMVRDGDHLSMYATYYPLHDVDEETREMHSRMATESPLDLDQLARATQNPIEDGADSPPFKHWSISDYTSRYLAGTTTPSQVAERIIRAVEEMNRDNGNSSIVTQMNAEELRLQAKESTKRYRSGNLLGVLDGVPILVKDEIPTKGHAITMGTSFLAGPVDEDLPPIRKLKDQGALIVGKTNQHEVGIGTTGFNLHNGTPRNPYGRDPSIHYYTGGSSSGSACSVSTGLVPLAIGSDGGGSIRIPSGLCGVVGLKPTFKRVAVDGNSSVSHVGPIASNAHDAAIAYAVMAGGTDSDHREQSRIQPPVHLHAYLKGARGPDGLRGLRIGIFDEHINDADVMVVEATKKAIDFYRSKGAEVVPITLPHLREIHMAHQVTITTEMFSKMEQYIRSDRFCDLCPETRVSLAVGGSWSASEFLAAQKVRTYAMRQVEDLFRNKADVLLSPATPCVAPAMDKKAISHGETNLVQTTLLMRYMIHGNLTGIPGIVFPVAYDEGTGLPISLQLQAAHWREDLLLRLARESEEILEGGIARPASYVNILGECGTAP